MNRLRPPDQVMRLPRLGAAHQTRLSFMRVLLRQMRDEHWRFDRPVWQIDARGVGRAVYRAIGPRRTYSLVAFAHDLPDHLRTDRVIAEAWDATFALVDGTPTEADLDRLAANVPLQEAGRVTDRELVLSRANRSVRLWAHVIDRLAAGQQPDPALLDRVGYLMRTTAVYGSGKFGAADYAARRDRPLLGGPFRAEMLTVWLIRSFVADLADRMAQARGGDAAVRLAPDTRRRLGIGNSTGLGMAPFLVNHPALVNAWILARETAISRVRALDRADTDAQALFVDRLARAQAMVTGWRTEHPQQLSRVADLRADLHLLHDHVATGALDLSNPWDRLVTWSEAALGLEAQELLASLILEPYGALVDDLGDRMAVDEAALTRIDGARSVADRRAALARHYGWALSQDFTTATDRARFWYVSEAKQEPRLGERAEDPGADLELPLDIAGAARMLDAELRLWPDAAPIREVLAARPAHRRMLRRLQIAETCPYSEIRDNLIASDMQPIDMLRCKLAFFGATWFDPRSDRWVRITMFQNAPEPGDLDTLHEDDWMFPAPPLPEAAE